MEIGVEMMTNDWFMSWGWILWIGFIFLIFSNMGNWGYTYSAHRKFSGPFGKDALDTLNERYARGEIDRGEFSRMKLEIASK
jgi:putative membrane protein